MSMKLKAQQVFDATLVLSQIIRANRAMPTKAAYRLARLHKKLLPEFQTLSERRDALITAYDHHAASVVDGVIMLDVPSEQFSVPEDKLPEFNAAWKEIGDSEIEVDAEPVPLNCFGNEATITSQEFVALGDLVTE